MDVETELKNTQARLNIISKSVKSLEAIILTKSGPHAEKAIRDRMEEWDALERQHPLESDDDKGLF